jgi:molybdopterin converting factor small subunit
VEHGLVRVRIHTLATLYEAAGRLEHIIDVPEGSSVLSVIRALVAEVPSLESLIFNNDRIDESIIVLLDGRPIHALKEGLRTRVKGESIITLIPPAAGG